MCQLWFYILSLFFIDSEGQDANPNSDEESDGKP